MTKKRPSSKANVFVLPQSVTEGYLQSSPTLEIEPPPVDVAITRDDLRVAYGGSNQQFLQYFEEGKNPSGPNRRHLVFPMVEMNPAMPFVPGEPGLIYASRHEILYDPPWTLFIKPDPKKSIWRYLGEYECVICGVMSAEMFRSQTDVVRSNCLSSSYTLIYTVIGQNYMGEVFVENESVRRICVDAGQNSIEKGQSLTDRTKG